MSSKSKVPVHQELQEIFDYTVHDLAANRTGKLSQKQVEQWKTLASLTWIQKLRNLKTQKPQERMIILYIVSGVMLLTAFVGLALIKFFDDQPLAIQCIFSTILIITLLAGSFLYEHYSRDIPSAIRKDMKKPSIATLRGQLKPTFSERRGMVLKIAGYNFRISEAQFEQLYSLKQKEPEQEYIFYYFPTAKIILSAEPTSMGKDHWFEG